MMILNSFLYRVVFWLGYITVCITSLINLSLTLDQKHLHLIAFDLRLDHLLHLGAYFFICMYYLVGQLKGLKLFETRSLTKFVLVIVLLATVTEVVQIWVPARAFNPFDILANVTGILIGLVVIGVVDGRRKMKEGRNIGG
jgi:VanZ family protein